MTYLQDLDTQNLKTLKFTSLAMLWSWNPYFCLRCILSAFDFHKGTPDPCFDRESLPSENHSVLVFSPLCCMAENMAFLLLASWNFSLFTGIILKMFTIPSHTEVHVLIHLSCPLGSKLKGKPHNHFGVLHMHR